MIVPYSKLSDVERLFTKKAISNAHCLHLLLALLYTHRNCYSCETWVLTSLRCQAVTGQCELKAFVAVAITFTGTHPTALTTSIQHCICIRLTWQVTSNFGITCPGGVTVYGSV